jgi:hypothetical protein
MFVLVVHRLLITESVVAEYALGPIGGRPLSLEEHLQLPKHHSEFIIISIISPWKLREWSSARK